MNKRYSEAFEMQFIVTIKQFIKDVRSIIVGFFYSVKWKVFYQNKGYLLNESRRDVPLIISLTSFPGRIKIVSKTLKSILMQNDIKPDSIQLWLAKEQFPKGVESLPAELKKLIKYGVEIKWCTDLRSYKKLVPCYAENRDAIIVTIDDDVYYSKYWLKTLYSSYLDKPNVVHCNKATKFVLKDDQYEAISGGREYYNSPSFLNKLVGIGGVLYPPNSLYKDVLDEKLFKKLAPTNDDIWFWFMAILNGYRISVVQNNKPKPIEVYEKIKSDKLTTINDNGDKLFWKQFDNMIKHYPSVNELFKEELKFMA